MQTKAEVKSLNCNKLQVSSKPELIYPEFSKLKFWQSLELDELGVEPWTLNTLDNMDFELAMKLKSSMKTPSLLRFRDIGFEA